MVLIYSTDVVKTALTLRGMLSSQWQVLLARILIMTQELQSHHWHHIACSFTQLSSLTFEDVSAKCPVWNNGSLCLFVFYVP